MPSRPQMEAEVQALLDDPQGGSVLIAEADGKIVGVLTASWQRAIHVPGVYGTVQDLWVDEDWRSRGVGDRKSTRLNSSHPSISYAVFCLKKKIAEAIWTHAVV